MTTSQITSGQIIPTIELHEDSPTYDEQVKGSTIVLRPHQRALLKKCMNLENVTVELDTNPYKYTQMTTKLGVIADKVGSGKSYVILSLIRENNIFQHPPRQNIYTIANGLIRLYDNENFQCVNTTILVVPHIIKKQWINYIETFDKNMKYTVIDTSRSLAAYIETVQRKSDGSIPSGVSNPQELLLVTGSMFGTLTKQLSYDVRFKYNRVVIDEVDTCKVSGMVFIPCHFIWLVTASWKNITNPLTNYRYDSITCANVVVHTGISNNAYVRQFVTRIFRDMSVTVTKHIFAKNRDDFVDKCLALPEPCIYTHICDTPVSIRVLQGNINSKILNHLHAGDVKGALSILNADKVDTEENIVKAILDEYETTRSNLQIKINALEAMTMSEKTKEEKMKKLQSDLQNVTSNIQNILDRIKENENMCLICYGDPYERTKCITSCCKNTMCVPCISQWLTNSRDCPLCRKSITINDVYVVDKDNIKMNDGASTSKAAQEKKKMMTKGDNLIKIIKESVSSGGAAKKVLVFSSYVNTLNNIKDELLVAGIASHMIKGIATHINRVVEEFKASTETKVLLMNSDFCGAGINLENTTDVILMHKFQSDVESQIIGRAQRPGRTEPLNIHYLVHSNE